MLWGLVGLFRFFADDGGAGLVRSILNVNYPLTSKTRTFNGVIRPLYPMLGNQEVQNRIAHTRAARTVFLCKLFNLLSHKISPLQETAP